MQSAGMTVRLKPDATDLRDQVAPY